jgi:16S rRNA (guanine527-N7)-methyltransferase
LTGAPTLAEGSARLGVALTPGQFAQLDAYLDAVLEINRSLNLTSIRDREDAVVRHLLDSLSIVPLWDELVGAPPKRVLDLGTGGGFPGAVLAVAWPTARVLMIDSTGKKVRAVANCLHAAGIRNAEAHQARGEQLPALRRETRGAFDLCVARAVGKAAGIVREFAPLVARRGHVFVMKGPNIAAEEVAFANEEAGRQGLTVEPVLTADVPGLDRRLVLVYTKR